MTTTTSTVQDRFGDRLRTALLGLVVPVVVVLLGTALLLTVRDRLPDPVATHWGPSGRADGFAAVSTVTWATGVLVLGCPLLVLVVALLVHRSAAHLLAGMASGLGVCMGVLAYGVVWSQRDVSDAAGMTMPGVWLAVGAVAGILVGAAVAWLLRPAPVPLPAHVTPPPADVPTLDVPPGTRLAWLGRATSSPVLVGLVGISILQLVVFALVLDPWMLVIAVPLAVLLLTLALVHVSVDARGLRVRSLVGLRWVDVPLERITSTSGGFAHSEGGSGGN